MKDVFFRDFEEKDYLEIPEIPNEKGIATHEDFLKWAEIRKKKGSAYTVTDKDGKIIACFGVQILWPGVGEVWVTFTELFNEYKREAVIFTGTILNKFQEMLELNRLQADVLADVEVSNKFVQHYGFVLEGRMRKYSPYGEDVNRYARIRGK